MDDKKFVVRPFHGCAFTVMTLKQIFILTLYVTKYLYYADGIYELHFNREPPEGTRCGICPTYFQKLCAFNFDTNETYIFDNTCIMDLFNCIHGTDFVKMNYENCLYFGNFAYVHGLKYEDYDYMEDHISIKHSKKNKDFAK